MRSWDREYLEGGASRQERPILRSTLNQLLVGVACIDHTAAGTVEFVDRRDKGLLMAPALHTRVDQIPPCD